MAYAKKHKATLVIAKLDRLARNVMSGLMEAGVEFVAADMPNADRSQLHLFAALAEQEARMISARTKAALVAAKERGTVLGSSGRALAAVQGRGGGARAAHRGRAARHEGPGHDCEGHCGRPERAGRTVARWGCVEAGQRASRAPERFRVTGQAHHTQRHFAPPVCSSRAAEKLRKPASC